MAMKTQNLLIRRVSVHDDEALFRIYGDIEHNAYNPSPPFPSIEHAQAVLNSWIAHWHSKGMGNHAITLKENEDYVIGFGGFSFKPFKGKEEISLGYKFTPEVWGKGYATEFVTGLMACTAFPAPMTRVIARTHPDNIASMRVLQKAGFHDLERHDNNDGMGLSAVFTRNIAGVQFP